MEDIRVNHNEVPSHFCLSTNSEDAVELPGLARISHQQMISWGDIQRNNRVCQFFEMYQNCRAQGLMPVMIVLADQNEQVVEPIPFSVDAPGVSECMNHTQGTSKRAPGIYCSAASRAVNSSFASAIAYGLIRSESNCDLRNNTMKRGLRRAAEFSVAYCSKATIDPYQSDRQNSRSGRIVDEASKSHSIGRIPVL